MEGLERDNVTHFVELPSWFKDQNLPTTIETQHHKVELCIVDEEIPEPAQYDGIVRMIDLSTLEQEHSTESPTMVTPLQAVKHDKDSKLPVLIVFNKIDKVAFSQQLLSRAARESVQAGNTSAVK